MPHDPSATSAHAWWNRKGHEMPWGHRAWTFMSIRSWSWHESTATWREICSQFSVVRDQEGPTAVWKKYCAVPAVAEAQEHSPPFALAWVVDQEELAEALHRQVKSANNKEPGYERTLTCWLSFLPHIVELVKRMPRCKVNNTRFVVYHPDFSIRGSV